MSGASLQIALERLMAGMQKPQHKRPSNDVYLLRLQGHYEDMLKKHDLKVGDVVRAKVGFAYVAPLLDGYPAIITRIFEPVQGSRTGEHDDLTFFDCNLLVIGDEGVAFEFAWSLCKLEPYSGVESAAQAEVDKNLTAFRQPADEQVADAA
jgi:hypothetical protein